MSDVTDIIEDLIEQVQTELGPAGISLEQSRRLEVCMRSRWGGQEIYVQKRERDLRGRAVRAEYNGTNRLAIQAKYGISRAQFYKLLKGG